MSGTHLTDFFLAREFAAGEACSLRIVVAQSGEGSWRHHQEIPTTWNHQGIGIPAKTIARRCSLLRSAVYIIAVAIGAERLYDFNLGHILNDEIQYLGLSIP